MFTVKDIEQRYDVTEATVLGWIHSGQLKAFNVGRTPGAKKPRWRVAAAELERFELTRAASAAPPKMRRRKQSEVPEFIK
jgi:transposase